MNAQIQHALQNDLVIDITTTGRKSGKPRRIEIWFHNIDEHLYITGLPGTRDWYANLVANPDFTFHLKESIQADLPATARAITDEAEKRAVLTLLLEKLSTTSGGNRNLEKWVAESPLIEVSINST